MNFVDNSLYNIKSSVDGKRYSLFELATWKNGLAFKKINFCETCVPVIKIAELNNGIGGTTAYTQQTFSEDVHLCKGDLLFSWSGNPQTSIDIFRFNLDEGWLNQHIFKVTPNEKTVDRDYFYFLMKNLKPHFTQIATNKQTTGLGHVTIADIKRMSIVIPSLDVQREIVSYIKPIDDKIELNNEINNNLEQQAEAIFQSILSNAITTVNLGEIADVKGGKRLPKGVNLIDIPNAHPYIRVRDLNNALFASLTPNYAYVDKETQKSISRYIVSTGDVLISIVGTIGLTAIVDSTLDKANLTENCVKVTNLKHITPEYLLLYLRSQLGREAIAKGTVGAVQQKLPIKNIQAIPIPLLSEKDKNALFCTLDSIFAGISNNVIQSAKLASLRDTLLPRLMSGELDVSDIDH